MPAAICFGRLPPRLVGLAGSLPFLLLTRLLLGAGESVAYPAYSKFLARDFPEERRGFANALIDAGSKVGPGLSMLTGGLTVARFGWRPLFIVLGLGSLFWLIPWLAWTRESHPNQRELSSIGPGWIEILRRRETWGTSLGMFALGYVWYFLLTWLPTYFVRERGLSMREMAVFGSLPFWAMAASSLLCGWMSDRSIRSGGDPTRVRKRYIASGLLLSGAALFPASVVTDTAACLTLMTLSCIFLGFFTSNVWAVTQTLAGPQAAGKWTAIQNAIGNLGGVASPLITGWIVQRTGSFVLAFAAATSVLFIGTIVYMSLVSRVRHVFEVSAIQQTADVALTVDLPRGRE